MSIRPSAGPRGRSALRRWPALILIAVAAILAVSLPTALTIPSSGPPTLAEYAPVPGSGEGESNVSELGQASSGGLGVGRATGPPQGAGALPGQPRPRIKRCVGNPPRQTEDQLSPPCVAFFQGDNGGSTTKGVTREEITVVRFSNNSTDPKFVDYAKPIDGSDNPEAVTGKVYARFFNDRYQTYGRYIHFWGYPVPAGTDPAAYRAAVVDIDNVKKPFAIVPETLGETTVIAEEAARRRIVVASYRGFDRTFYHSVSPLVYSYAPETEESAKFAAGYTCSKLVGRPAKHSGNPADLNKTRVFGMIYSVEANRPSEGALAAKLKAELKSQCGAEIAREATYSNIQESLSTPAVLRAADVTTVFLLGGCCTLTVMNSANSQGWYPEWVPPRQLGGSADDTASGQVEPQSEMAHVFGPSYDYRRGPIISQPWHLAFKDACPNCEVPRGYPTPRTYEIMSMLMYGIQAAGPRLTNATLDKGLHAIPERPSQSPYIPATYFTTGNYSWVKDMKEMWWDPAGIAPGSNQPGCYRLPNGGNRYRVGEWPEGDTEFNASTDPCQGPAQIF